MNVLVTGAWKNADLKRIEDMGHNVLFMQNEKDDLPCDYSWVEGVIGNGLFLSHPIEKFVNLKYIQLTSAGFDRVPMEYVKAHNISIFNARGVYSIPMAEHAVLGVLSIYRGAEKFSENRKIKRWEKQRDLLEIFGKSVLIIGCGNVGTECAKRFRAFGAKILGIDVKPYKNEFFDSMQGIEKLSENIKSADIVIVCAALTEDSKGLVKPTQMKKDSVLVNISRGAIIDTNDLLKADNLRGAVLDVFDEEPLNENSPIWEKENFIVTPHNSFVGDGNEKRLNDVIFKNLEAYKS